MAAACAPLARPWARALRSLARRRAAARRRVVSGGLTHLWAVGSAASAHPRGRYVFAWLLASVCGCFLLIPMGNAADRDAAKEKIHARFTFAGLCRFFFCRNLDTDGLSVSPSV